MDSTKTPAYTPADLRDPETNKPIFLQSHLLSSMFEELMLAWVFSFVLPSGLSKKYFDFLDP